MQRGAESASAARGNDQRLLERGIVHHDYRVEKAKRFLESAHLALEHGYYETAVSRAYYSVYHLVAWALMEHRGIDRSRWDHFQIVNEFYNHFCKRGYLFSMADGRDLQQLLDSRLDADYANVDFNNRKTARLLERAGALANKIQETKR
jgi:uncharacterized protein (UPF0332 family)